MASRDFDATRDPRNLETALGLQSGVLYFVQNVDARATLRLRGAEVKPSPGMRAHKIEAGGDLMIQPDAVAGIWVWTDEDSCAVIVTEAPGG